MLFLGESCLLYREHQCVLNEITLTKHFFLGYYQQLYIIILLLGITYIFYEHTIRKTGYALIIIL